MTQEHRDMPTKRDVLDWWQDELFDAPKTTDVCWACGFKAGTERAHILDRCKGGIDEPSNLALLCKPCHAIQETYVYVNGPYRFASRLKDGALFMAAKMRYYKSIIDG